MKEQPGNASTTTNKGTFIYVVIGEPDGENLTVEVSRGLIEFIMSVASPRSSGAAPRWRRHHFLRLSFEDWDQLVKAVDKEVKIR